MTATPTSLPAPTPAAPIPFRRLLAVETRKLFDTLGGRILCAVLLAVTLAAVAGRAVYTGPKLYTLIGTAGIGFGTLLPVLGILVVTAEWSQRTALTTFALEPRRVRVLAAKVIPPLWTAIAASAFACVVGIVATAVVPGNADWHVDPARLLGWTATNVLVVAMGLALGLLLLNAPAAIAICLSTPMVWAAVKGVGGTGQALAGWFDLNTATDALASGRMSTGDTARLAVAVATWLLAPAVLGVLRVRRKEIR